MAPHFRLVCAMVLFFLRCDVCICSTCLTLKPVLVALLFWGPNANCNLEGSWQGSARTVGQRRLCSDWLGGVCPTIFLGSWGHYSCNSAVCPKTIRKNNIQVTEKRTENMIVFEMLAKENKLTNVFFLYIFFRVFEVHVPVWCEPQASLTTNVKISKKISPLAPRTHNILPHSCVLCTSQKR